MKKIAIVGILALAATSAFAADFGVNFGRDYAGADRNGYGLTLGQKYGKIGAEAGVEHFTRGANNQNRYSLIGSYDVFTAGPVTFAAKAGGAYLDNQFGSDGYALVTGVGASMPIAKNLAATVDVKHQNGQARVEAFNGNTVSAGLKYSF